MGGEYIDESSILQMEKLSHREGSSRVIQLEKDRSRIQSQGKGQSVAAKSWSLCECVKVAQSCLTFATQWTVQFMEFSRPEYWIGQPIPSPTDLPKPGIELGPSVLQADSLPTELSGKPDVWQKPIQYYKAIIFQLKINTFNYF